MKKNRFPLMIVLLAAVVLLGFYEKYYNAVIEQITEQGSGSETEKVSFDDSGDTTGKSENLSDNDALYEDDDPYDVVTMYLTVRSGNSTDGTDHTWEDLNSYSMYDYEDMGVDPYKVEGILQVGDDKGPVMGELGYGVSATNATVSIRGQSSSEGAQKNYKIKLKDNSGSWNGQTTIDLNKHQGEGLRFRNKMMFDLMSEIDETMSLQTQFVHLYVKDETGKSKTGFVDYGLYTQVEQLNKTALEAHGLNKEGQLYKVNDFEFYRYEDIIKMADDPDYDKDAFDELLETKGDSDNTKLIDMLDDLNDDSIPIETVLKDHFNTENLTYWMAMMLLTGNIDTQCRNMYLYSPLNSDTWYIIPWDCDGAFLSYEYDMQEQSKYTDWNYGLSNYWGNVLFKKCIQSETFRTELDAAINDLRTNYLTEEHISEIATKYAATVEPYLFSEPDVEYMPITKATFEKEVAALPSIVEDNYQKYLTSLQKPMPFYIGIPNADDKKNWTIYWDDSYDIQGQDITYNMTISKNPDMKDEVKTYKGKDNEYSFAALPEGQYFVKVTATDSDGNTQMSFDSYYGADKVTYYGVKCFYVLADGTVTEESASE